MIKNEYTYTPEMLLWEEMEKTYFSKGRDDIDLSYLNVGDLLHTFAARNSIINY